jgi:hypothetical protein
MLLPVVIIVVSHACTGPNQLPPPGESGSNYSSIETAPYLQRYLSPGGCGRGQRENKERGGE